MTVTCNECDGTGVIKVPEYNSIIASTTLAVIYQEIECVICEGNGWRDIPIVIPGSGQVIDA